MTMLIKNSNSRRGCASDSEHQQKGQEDKKSKTSSTKTNVPKWSNPEYKNQTSEETRLELERKKQEMLARLEEGGD